MVPPESVVDIVVPSVGNDCSLKVNEETEGTGVEAAVAAESNEARVAESNEALVKET